MATQTKNNAKMLDVGTLIAAGFDPRTGLPRKLDNSSVVKDLKADFKQQFQLVDKANAINRYTWYNLPKGLTGQLVERILYYRGQGMFFFIPETETFYFLPYALSGTIDVYGRYTEVVPVQFNGSTTEVNNDGKVKQLDVWLSTQSRIPQYGVVSPQDLNLDIFERGCVLLKDYSEELSESIIPRVSLQQGVIDIMSDIVPFLRTNLIKGSGVSAMRVTSEDEQSNVIAAAQSTYEAALGGRLWIPTVGDIDFQDLTGANLAKPEEFTMALQSMDNLRLSMLGLDNGGLFQKKAHMLQSEQAMNSGSPSISLVMQDGLTMRQNFCNIVNSIWGLGVWCEVSETVSGADLDGNGVLYDANGDNNNEQGPAEVNDNGNNEQ